MRRDGVTLRKTLIVVAGPERSGKMPLARELLKEGPDRYIVHRDTIRASIEAPMDEWTITLLMRHVAQFMLIHRFTPIVVAWNHTIEDRMLFEGLAAEQSAKLFWLDTREPSVRAIIPPLPDVEARP